MSTIAVIGGYGMKGLEVRNPYDLNSRKKWLKSTLPFTIKEYEERVSSIQKRIRNDGLDGLIIHGDKNENGFIRWVSNFAPLYGSTHIVVPSDGEIALISDSGTAWGAHALALVDDLGSRRPADETCIGSTARGSDRRTRRKASRRARDQTGLGG